MQQDRTLRIPSESDASDASDVETPTSHASTERRAFAYMWGLALLVAALYAAGAYQSGPFLHQGNVEQTVELAEKEKAPGSTFYLIKHSFDKKADSEDYWKWAKGADWKKIGAHNAAEGFYNGYFFPTAADGPFFCLWEAEAGKTKEDMQHFVDTWLKDIKISVKNHVMELPAKLTGGAPMNIPPFFPAKASKPMKPQESKSTFYLIEHTFKKESDIKSFWKFMKVADWKKIGKDNAAAGFHNDYFFPTAAGGPFFCLWEAEEGKTEKDMQTHVDKWTKDGIKIPFKNHVMEIPSKLTRGPPMNIPVFFEPKKKHELK